MSNNKYACPQCGSQLIHHSLCQYAHEQTINKRTGELNKKTKYVDCGTLEASIIFCSNKENCNFSLDVDESPDFLENPISFTQERNK